ncbi:hypothetical protein EUX98_g1950 [Antrodiella citrinella]|uniref:Uncharacterized protein n=1 Tax=Antrodiella citrinella TaxID=2447956 RepID=A0A4S4N079_9APHY|nr:hypothetical protein EUX98_g1950 [Antrodiella citrinella]
MGMDMGTSMSGDTHAAIVAHLEARIEKLEAALALEKKKREVLAAGHQAEFRRLYHMFRVTMLGQ